MKRFYTLSTIGIVIIVFSSLIKLEGVHSDSIFTYNSEASAQAKLNHIESLKKEPTKVEKVDVQTKSSKFFYQAKTGECINAKGEKGFNQIHLSSLFDGLDKAQLSSPNYQPKQVYENKDAECTDFSNFDFNHIIKLSYVRLDKWNFKGSNLDGAAFAFAKMIDADLRGAKLSGISIGYTYISGQVDRFTEYPKVCVLRQLSRGQITQFIKCEL